MGRSCLCIDQTEALGKELYAGQYISLKPNAYTFGEKLEKRRHQRAAGMHFVAGDTRLRWSYLTTATSSLQRV